MKHRFPIGQRKFQCCIDTIVQGIDGRMPPDNPLRIRHCADIHFTKIAVRKRAIAEYASSFLIH